MHQFHMAGVVLVVGAFAVGAHAQSSYSREAAKQRQCQLHGEAGEEAFTKGTVFGKSLKEHADDARRGTLPKKALTDIALIYSSSTAAGIRTAKDAYMAAWAECMDSR